MASSKGGRDAGGLVDQQEIFLGPAGGDRVRRQKLQQAAPVLDVSGADLGLG
jgi:hypothetical protein